MSALGERKERGNGKVNGSSRATSFLSGGEGGQVLQISGK